MKTTGYIELIEKYRIEQEEGDYNPPSYIHHDNTGVIVRCRDCKYQDKGENETEAWNLCGYRPWIHLPTEDDNYCKYGVRKDG